MQIEVDYEREKHLKNKTEKQTNLSENYIKFSKFFKQ